MVIEILAGAAFFIGGLWLMKKAFEAIGLL